MKLPHWPLPAKQETIYETTSFLCKRVVRLAWCAVWPPARHTGPRSHSRSQCAWGSSPWPRPSICLSSSAKLQGTTHYRVILLIGPLSSLPHSCRVPPYSVRMEYACKPPSMKRLHHGPPSFSHVKAQAGKYCAFKLKYYLERWAIPKPSSKQFNIEDLFKMMSLLPGDPIRFLSRR